MVRLVKLPVGLVTVCDERRFVEKFELEAICNV